MSIDNPPQQNVILDVDNPTSEHQPFKEQLQQALADEQMHAALERFAPSWRASRKSVFEYEESEYGPEYSFPHMRHQLRQAKDYAIEHQEEMVAQFKKWPRRQELLSTKRAQQKTRTAISTNSASAKASNWLSNPRRW